MVTDAQPSVVVMAAAWSTIRSRVDRPGVVAMPASLGTTLPRAAHPVAVVRRRGGLVMNVSTTAARAMAPTVV